MQLKRVVLFGGKIFQTANCTARKCFVMFLFFSSHPTCRLFISRQCEKQAPARFQFACLKRTMSRANVTLLDKLFHVWPANQIPPIIVPLARVSNMISTLSQRTCVHRGVCFFLFCFLYKSEKYYFRHRHSKPGHNVIFNLRLL